MDNQRKKNEYVAYKRIKINQNIKILKVLSSLLLPFIPGPNY